MNLDRLERELRKRHAYPYHWGRKQSNLWDTQTHFIYQTESFETLLAKSKNLSKDLQNYPMNRWYNFWSAKAAEYLFGQHAKVSANQNIYDKFVDFKIEHISFDLKISVFPKSFGPRIEYAIEHKKELIYWLYNNQSQGSRKHMKNRLFILLYNKTKKEHWKLKAEIKLLKKND